MSDPSSTLNLSPATSALLVIDFQERLFTAMPEHRRELAARATGNLAFAARSLDVPVLLTEQYPKGLGSTIGSVADELGGVSAVEKTEFSVCLVEAAGPQLDQLAGRTVIVAGMETHVCVFQTVRDLVARGFSVHVAHDAVLSRTEDNRRIGLDLCREAGATISGSETVVFDWLKQAGGDVFKAYSRRIR